MGDVCSHLVSQGSPLLAEARNGTNPNPNANVDAMNLRLSVYAVSSPKSSPGVLPLPPLPRLQLVDEGEAEMIEIGANWNEAASNAKNITVKSTRTAIIELPASHLRTVCKI